MAPPAPWRPRWTTAGRAVVVPARTAGLLRPARRGRALLGRPVVCDPPARPQQPSRPAGVVGASVDGASAGPLTGASVAEAVRLSGVPYAPPAVVAGRVALRSPLELDFGGGAELVETTSTNCLYGGTIDKERYCDVARAAGSRSSFELTRVFAPEPGVVLCRWRTPPTLDPRGRGASDFYIEGTTELRASKGNFADGVDAHVERWEVRASSPEESRGAVLAPVLCALRFALTHVPSSTNKPFGVVAAVRASVWTAIRDNEELGVGSEVVREELDLVTDQFLIALVALSASNAFLLYAVVKRLTM